MKIDENMGTAPFTVNEMPTPKDLQAVARSDFPGEAREIERRVCMAGRYRKNADSCMTDAKFFIDSAINALANMNPGDFEPFRARLTNARDYGYARENLITAGMLINTAIRNMEVAIKTLVVEGRDV